MSTEVSVSTSAMHLVGDSSNPITEAIMSAIIEGKRLPETIMKTVFRGMGIRMQRAHKYAKESYTLGLPSGQTSLIEGISDEELAPIVAVDISYPDGVVVEFNQYTTVTPGRAMLQYLYDVRGYDDVTNLITIYPLDVDFDNPEEYDERMALVSVFLNVNLVDADITYTVEVYRYFEPFEAPPYYEWVAEPPYSETIPIPDVANLTFGADCVFAKYQKLDEFGDVILGDFTWIYEFSENLYPELTLDGELQEFDEFLPVIPIRYNNTDYTSPIWDGTPLFETSKVLLNKLNMDFEYLGTNVNENPDIAEIDHAYVMFGIDIQTEANASILYLNLFFDHLYNIQRSSQLDYDTAIGAPVIDYIPQNSYLSASNTSISFLEYGLNLRVIHDYITSETINGVVGTGKIGESTKTAEPYETINLGPFNNPETVVKHKLILETQVTKTLLRRVIVHGLETENLIYNSYSVVTTMGEAAQDPNNHNLILPVQFNLAQDLNLIQRNYLYNDASLMVVNAYDVQDLEWYEETWFLNLIIIVAVVISIVSTQVWIANLAVAINAGTAALIGYLAMTVLLSLAIDMTMEWLVDEYGEDIGIIGSILLAVAAFYFSRGRSTITFAQYTMSTAQLMLQLSTALISSTNEFLIGEAQDIADEYSDFSDNLEDRYEDLRVSIDLLDRHNKVDLNPLAFARPNSFKSVPNEVPSAFYKRSLGLAENTMSVVHREIPNFISDRLKLPEPLLT